MLYFFRLNKEEVMGYPKRNAKIGCPIEKATTETQGQVSKKDKPNSCKDIVPGI